MSSAFEGIKAGLESAIAFVQGDHTRGRVVRGEWPVPKATPSRQPHAATPKIDGDDDASFAGEMVIHLRVQRPLAERLLQRIKQAALIEGRSGVSASEKLVQYRVR